MPSNSIAAVGRLATYPILTSVGPELGLCAGPTVGFVKRGPPSLEAGYVLQVYRPKPRGTTKLVTVKGKKIKIIKEDFTAGAAVVHVVNRVSGKHNPTHRPMPAE